MTVDSDVVSQKIVHLPSGYCTLSKSYNYNATTIVVEPYGEALFACLKEKKDWYARGNREGTFFRYSLPDLNFLGEVIELRFPRHLTLAVTVPNTLERCGDSGLKIH